MPKLGQLISGNLKNLQSTLFGTEGKFKNIETLTPEQKQALLSALGATEQLPGAFEKLGGFDITQQEPFQAGQKALTDLLGGFDPSRTTEAFQSNVADPAIKQFQEQIAPGIQERFIGAGAGRSSAGQRQLSQAGASLESGLSGQLAEQLRAGEQQGMQGQLGALTQALGFSQAPQAGTSSVIDQLLKSLGIGLGTPSFQTAFQPGTSGIGGQAAAALMQALL